MISTAKSATVRAASPLVRTPSPINTKLTSTPPSTPKNMTPQIKKNHTVPVVKVERSQEAQAELVNLKKSQSLTEKAVTSNTSSSSKNSSNANTNANNAKNSSASTASGGGSAKKASPRKLLPCKDREFDANKHCGVWINDIQKHCTRSLTCKTHALSLRRAVQGRRKPFDELLAEHRARREKELQLANQAKLQQQQQKQQQLLLQKQQQQQQLLQTSQDNQCGKTSDESLAKTTSPPKTLSAYSHPPKRPLSSSAQSGATQRQSSSATVNSSQQQSSSHTSDSRTASDGEYDASDDLDGINCPYITHHPKPAAMCTFGARLMGRGCYVFNRKADYVRSSVLSLVERHLNPPPFKKLCVPNKSATGTQALPVEYMNSQSVSPAVSAMSSKASVANGPLNKSQNLNKKSKPSNKQSSKSKDAHPTSKTKARRKSGGGAAGVNPSNVMPSLTSPGAVTIPLSSGSVAGFNINPTTYTDMGQGIVSSGTGNLIKDLSIVVTNIDANVNNSGLTPGQVINGVSTANTQMLTSAGQLVTPSMSGPIATMSSQQLSTSGQAAQLSHAGLQLHAGVPIASINAGSINIATNMQGGIINTIGETKITNVGNAKVGGASKGNVKARSKGTVHKQGSLSRAPTAWQSSSNVSRTDMHDANSNGPSSAQPSPSSVSTTPSPHFRPGSISPQMSAQSPLSNGFIPSPSAVNIKSFPPSSINPFSTISPSRNSTPSPITSSTEASPNNSGHFTSVFTPTGKGSSSSSAASRANTNFQKQIQKQPSVAAAQPSPVQPLRPQLHLQQHPPQITASIVAATQPGKTLQLTNSTLMPSTPIFPNMQQLPSGLIADQGKVPPLALQQMTIRLPIQQNQTLTIPHQTTQQKTLDHKQAMLGQSEKPL
ncbi:ataxin-7-like protein 1 isoform X2 [Ptychodera flava]